MNTDLGNVVRVLADWEIDEVSGGATADPADQGGGQPKPKTNKSGTDGPLPIITGLP